MQNKWRGRVRSPKLIIATILVLVALVAFNQEAIAGVTGKIAGTVRDSETGETLPAANCVLVGTELGAAADADGDYFVINIPPGIYSLEVRMMGYESVTQTGIIVSADHTTPIDFELRPVAIEVPGITIVAEREIVKMDISSSYITARSEEIEAVPMIKHVGDYVNLQAGIEGWEIRGGGESETKFLINGLYLVDNRTNSILMEPNLSSVKEINILKGGFNAEYGNVRSGVINVVTREGSRKKYQGSIHFRWTPPYYKHRGSSVFSPENYYLRPYLEEEDSICWLGTGVWLEKGDTASFNSYPNFPGWISVSEDYLNRGDTISPEACRNLYVWNHRVDVPWIDTIIPEDYDGLPRVGSYGNKPDWMIDAGFGGPIPIPGLNDKLTFFASYRTDWESFGLPTVRDYYKEENAQLNLAYSVSKNKKLRFVGMYGVTHSAAKGSQQGPYAWGGNDAYLRSGSDILYNSVHTWERDLYMYWSDGTVPFDVFRTMAGITFEHAITPSTFYTIRLTQSHRKNWANGPRIWRDTTIVRYFGSIPVDEQPYGFKAEYEVMRGGLWNFDISGDGAFTRDWSESWTTYFEADLTSQINKYNEIKTGITINYDWLKTHYGFEDVIQPQRNSFVKTDDDPYMISAYLQDKINYAGMIANVGVRLDYINPNTEWYTVDRYSEYFSDRFREVFREVTPTEPTKDHLRISPRFGISHPIGENAKLFFNYGHFYQRAVTSNMFEIQYNIGSGITRLGNPSLDLPRTIAYELGFEQSIGGLLLHLAGYYKDIDYQIGSVSYTDFDGTVDYTTYENHNYADIRGFEISLNKRFGFINGWINYDYTVTTSGYVGRQHYYEDPRLQKVEGLRNPVQERPLSRPVLRANIGFTSPEDFGPLFGGINPLGNVNLRFLYSWRAGRYQYDILGIHELGKQDLVQWKAYSNWDAKLSKEIVMAGIHLSLFAEIYNLFDWKTLSTSGFASSDDMNMYYRSLHLPLYEEEEYVGLGLTAGEDQLGDIKSDKKPYIDMPNREFLTFRNPRYFTFGVRFEF